MGKTQRSNSDAQDQFKSILEFINSFARPELSFSVYQDPPSSGRVRGRQLVRYDVDHSIIEDIVSPGVNERQVFPGIKCNMDVN
jgi:hypothetical protein